MTMLHSVFAAVLMCCIFMQNNHCHAAWHAPELESFASYADMQRYFDARNLRSLRFIDNPTHDSYIEAYNKHNEQKTERKQRIKRSTVEKKLPIEPTLIKFQLSDAVEPSEDLKKIINQHRSRELKLNGSKTNETKAETTLKPTQESKENQSPRKTYKNKSVRKLRTKRSTSSKKSKNFDNVKLIAFELSDAKEPDEQTKLLIKRNRALEIQKSTLTTSPLSSNLTTESTAQQKSNQRNSNRSKQHRRAKRAAQLNAPHIIKFELSDAKEPSESLKSILKKTQSRSSKQLDLQPSKLITIEVKVANDTKSKLSNEVDAKDDNVANNEAAESSRTFYYQDPPVKTKTSINSLPVEVQKVITHIMKSNHGGKAYVKYLPVHTHDYNQLKSAYGSKLNIPNYILKYPEVATSKQHLPSTLKKTEVQIQSVPVEEKLRYVYAPVSALQQHPIVVPDTMHKMPTEVHHTYTADLTHLAHNEDSEPLKTVAAPTIYAIKPDPQYEQNTLIDANSHSGLENYKYDHHADDLKNYYSTPAQQLIKVEYLATPDALPENYKEFKEFKDLSTLIGKSPDDQIHGLSYLLAKEMQNKLQRYRQAKKLISITRPQDSTSPIVFHPEESKQQLQRQQQQHQQHHHQETQQHRHQIKFPTDGYGRLGVQRAKLIGMAKTKQYVPIVEQTPDEAQKDASEIPNAYVVEKDAFDLKTPTATSYLNYNAATKYTDFGAKLLPPKIEELVYDNVVHQPTSVHVSPQHDTADLDVGLQVSATAAPQSIDDEHKSAEQHAAAAASGVNVKHGKSFVNYGIHHDDDLQYASKYAFGYRIRDFYTGNDFGHKQNRDLDGVTRGQYHILLPDGRIQNVIYHADDSGFHADVSFAGTGSHH